MNIDTSIDYPFYYERDEQSFGYFLLGRKKIDTETVTCRQMGFWAKHFGKNYQTINGSNLYDVLKNGSIYRVCLTVTEPIFICVHFTDNSRRSSEFYKISFGSFIFFQEKYCKSYDNFIEEKTSWKKEGF
jgi:hypothetical protein